MKSPHFYDYYRNLRYDNITAPQHRHIFMLLYWPLFGFLFWFAEKFYPVTTYNVVYTPLDSIIPFCELFVFPYVLWYFYLIGIHIYTFFYDIPAFKKLMKYIIFTYTVTLVIYFIFPTCQLLRPVTFERQNILTRFMAWFYTFDTNTNVCPSLHVIGSMAVMHTAWHTKGLESSKCKYAFGITTFLISISTVFLKQHSVMDIALALPICMLAYRLFFTGSKETSDKPYNRKPVFIRKLKKRFQF